MVTMVITCGVRADEPVATPEPTPATPTTPAAPATPADAAASTPTPSTIPAPPGVTESQLRVMQGERRERALMPFTEILKRIVATAPATPLPPPRVADPPLAAQRAYLAGILAWRDGHLFEARRQLELAINLDPGQPEILKALGEIAAASGNRLRATQYLEQALAANPDDLDIAFHLGRQAIEQGLWDAAVRLLAGARQQADGRPRDDDAMPVILDYFLGNALERMEHDAAAAERIEAFLLAPSPRARNQNIARHLSILDGQRGVLWQMVGDSRLRLDQPALASEAYRRAAEAGVAEPAPLVGRAMYAKAVQGNIEAVGELLVTYLREHGTEPAAPTLVRYAGALGADRAKLAKAMQAVYENADDSAKSLLAVQVAELLDDQDGSKFILEHVERRPDDRLAVQHLIGRTLKAGDEKSIITALRIAADAIDASPIRADDFAMTLIGGVDQPESVVRAVNELEADQQGRPAVRFILALALMHMNRLDASEPLLEGIIEDRPAMSAATVRLAMVRVAQGDPAKAAALLETLPGLGPVAAEPENQDPIRNNPIVVRLLVQVLTLTDRGPDALALLDRLLTEQPGNLDLVLQKAGLQIRLDQGTAAERTLLDALNTRPEAEPLYEALFDLYDNPGRIADATDQYKRLMHRMLGTIPQSRIARLKLSDLHAAQRDFGLAEKMLRELLTENEQDYKALAQLTDILRQAERAADAEELINERLKRDPADRALLQIAYIHYLRTQNQGKQYEIQERMLMLLPDGPDRARALGALYVQWVKPEQAVVVLEKALEDPELPMEDRITLIRLLSRALSTLDRFADIDALYTAAIADPRAAGTELEADLRFYWAMNVEFRGEKGRGQQMMEQLLEKFPDHAASNNGLGYTWADAGKNLERAKAMILRAVEAEPNNSAYLDSLGWVHYKLGNFDEAVRWLKQAQASEDGDYPVILDHLGDALFRAGQSREATQIWQRALEQHQQRVRADASALTDDPEMRGLDERLRAKIEAVRARKAPPLADSPGPPDPPAPMPPPAPPAP